MPQLEEVKILYIFIIIRWQFQGSYEEVYKKKALLAGYKKRKPFCFLGLNDVRQLVRSKCVWMCVPCLYDAC